MNGTLQVVQWNGILVACEINSLDEVYLQYYFKISGVGW